MPTIEKLNIVGIVVPWGQVGIGIEITVTTSSDAIRDMNIKR
jgi:hypothetical protein